MRIRPFPIGVTGCGILEVAAFRLMTEKEFLEQLYSSIDPTEDVELTMDTDLAECEYYDSLAQLGIIVMFETMAGKTITAEDLEANTKVRSLYEFYIG